jgi:hypothetical protein
MGKTLNDNKALLNIPRAALMLGNKLKLGLRAFLEKFTHIINY